MSSQHNKRVQYSPSKMRAAIEMVRSNGMAKAKAAKLFGVPRTTLIDKLAGRVPEEATRPGPSSVLTPAEEKTLVRYADLMAQIGYPLTRKELLYETKRILDIDGRKTVFRDNLPGKGWYKAFRMRNPELVERTPAALGHQRAAISMSMIQGWYDGLFRFLREEIPDFQDMISDPRRVFNADESGFPICVKSTKVLAPTGSRHVYQVLPGDKTQITVLACFNAFGDYMSPLIIYPGQRFRDTVLSGFEEAIFGMTKNGWMDSELFLSFLEHFDSYLIEKKINRPVILFVDGHSTHMSLPAANFCSEKSIILYCLLPNSTHVLQACDIGLFSPMKSKWKEMVKKWQMEHLGEPFTKAHFPEVFKSTWTSVANLTNCVCAFKRSGLFPLTPDGIDQSKLGPSKMTNNCSLPSTTVPPPAASGQEGLSQTPSVACLPPSLPVSCYTPRETSLSIASSPVHGIVPQIPSEACLPPPLHISSNKTSQETSSSFASSHGVIPQIPSVACAPTPLHVSSCITSQETSISNAPMTVGSGAYTFTPTFTGPFASEQQPLTAVSTNSMSVIQPVLASTSSAPSSVMSVLRPKSDNTFVSPAFNHLRVPQPKKIKNTNTIRQRLPKALSGSEALKMLREKEEKKLREEQEKQERKEERARKKREREEEKERKKKEREITKKIKLLEKKKQRRSNDSDESDENIPFMDSSDEDTDVTCPGCLSSEGIDDEWIGCESCPLWWHIDCTGRDDFVGKTSEELKRESFVCEFCEEL